MKSRTIRLVGKRQVDSAIAALHECHKDAETWCMELSIEQQTRSKKQNRLIHALFRQIADEATHVMEGDTATPKGWKWFFKTEFLQTTHEYVNGKLVVIPAKTSDLTKIQCSEFVSDILNWCQSAGLNITMKTYEYDFLVGMK